jgi:hypothetical protein
VCVNVAQGLREVTIFVLLTSTRAEKLAEVRCCRSEQTSALIMSLQRITLQGTFTSIVTRMEITWRTRKIDTGPEKVDYIYVTCFILFVTARDLPNHDVRVVHHSKGLLELYIQFTGFNQISSALSLICQVLQLESTGDNFL